MVDSLDTDALHTECGLFAYFNPYKKQPVDIAVNGLSLLQHRGQECAGISYSLDNKTIVVRKDFGFVDEIFSATQTLPQDNVPHKYSVVNNNYSNICVGHVRYSTSGQKRCYEHIQPLGNKTLVVAHNGNIPVLPTGYTHDTTYVFDYLAGNFEGKTKCVDTCDTCENDIISMSSGENGENDDSVVMAKLLEFGKKIPGAYCLCIMTPTSLFAMRDRYGIRPLCLAKNSEGTWFVSSESVAFGDDAIRIRDIAPGEIIRFNQDGSTNSEFLPRVNQRAHCLFEHIYFLRKDTIADGIHVERFRKQCGNVLAKTETLLFDPDHTIVVGAPHTGIPVALEYATFLGLPYKQVLNKIKKRRTFILPNQRDEACDTIYQYHTYEISNKHIVLIDDSIVRGTTLKSIAKQFWDRGALSVHIRVASPPVVSECYFGIDIPTKTELIAARLQSNTQAIIEEVRLTSLRYMTLDETLSALNGNGFCTGCFSGKYPDGLLDW